MTGASRSSARVTCPALLDEAREAVRVCPKLALRLEGPH